MHFVRLQVITGYQENLTDLFKNTKLWSQKVKLIALARKRGTYWPVDHFVSHYLS